MFIALCYKSKPFSCSFHISGQQSHSEVTTSMSNFSASAGYPNNVDNVDKTKAKVLIHFDMIKILKTKLVYPFLLS